MLLRGYRQNALLQAYPDVLVKYRFTNRGGTRFTREMFDACQLAINRQSRARGPFCDDAGQNH